MDNFTIELKHPIPIKDSNGLDVKITELKMGRLKVKHFKLIPKNMFSLDKKKRSVSPIELIPLIAGLCCVDQSIVEEVDLDDLIEIIEELTKLLGESKIQMALS